MKIVTDERVGEFVSSRSGIDFALPATFLGIERDGEIVLGVVFNGYTGPNVDISVAGGPWPRGFLERMGRYVFDELGCIRMTAHTEQERVVELACRVGGSAEGCLRNYYGQGRDAVIIGILKSEYRFYEKPEGPGSA